MLQGAQDMVPGNPAEHRRPSAARLQIYLMLTCSHIKPMPGHIMRMLLLPKCARSTALRSDAPGVVQAAQDKTPRNMAEYRQLMAVLDESAGRSIQQHLEGMANVNEMHVARTLSTLLQIGRAHV